MILGVGFLLMVSLIASAMLAALQRWFSELVDFGLIAQAIDFAVSFLFVTVAFAMIYKLMPSVRVHWRDVGVGAVVTALLFTIGKTLIGMYIGRSGVASVFGAAASLVADAGLGVLVGADLPVRRRVHLGLRAPRRIAARPRGSPAGARRTPRPVAQRSRKRPTLAGQREQALCPTADRQRRRGIAHACRRCSADRLAGTDAMLRAWNPAISSSNTWPVNCRPWKWAACP
jgi:hypothetical protein